jgi:NAD(P)H dehydrogenase (quinone)
MLQLARAAATGAEEAGAEVRLVQIGETLPDDVLAKTGGLEARKAFADIPIVTHDDLRWADGIVFGVPTRYGNAPAQVAAFFDTWGQLWSAGALVGKVGSVMSSAATQHGGAETTILSVHTTLLANGFVIAGLPYKKHPGLFEIEQMSGGSVFGATTITGGTGARLPSENELAGAKAQGKWTAVLAGRLAA